MSDHPALLAAEEDFGRSRLRVLLIENGARIHRMPFHRKRLVLLLSAMRHYAEGLRGSGYCVDLIQAPTLAAGLEIHIGGWKPTHFYTMAGSEFDGRAFQEGGLEMIIGFRPTVLQNTQFFVGRFDPYPSPEPGRRYVMEHFYRALRKRFDILMLDDGQPKGENGTTKSSIGSHCPMG